MHARSYVNPLFQAVYYEQAVPFAREVPDVRQDVQRCFSCHAPTMEERMGWDVSLEEADLGISCDFCHTVTGVDGENPGSGNYVSSPGYVKYGPFPCKSFHRSYSSLHRSSRFCGPCHDDVNIHGVSVKSTYTEWSESVYARKGIQCQDCHMNKHGYLKRGRPLFESGRAAAMNVGDVPYRKRLHTHTFPGAYSQKQLRRSADLKIMPSTLSAGPGERVMVRVLVRNTRAGHMMPTGSTELRLLWLELVAAHDRGAMSVPAGHQEAGVPFDVCGAVESDVAVGDAPLGSRVYRRLFVDEEGRMTHAHYAAREAVFDNRLGPRETRTETYHVTVPVEAEGPLVLMSRLYYMPVPSAVAGTLGIPPGNPQEVATARMVIYVEETEPEVIY
jgi:hypothetical protein